MALNTADEILNSVLPEWHKLLQGWAADGSLVAAAQEALMLSGEPEALKNLVAQWSAGDFSGIPRIVLLPSADMNGAMGAYAISTGTIYLNADWLAGATQVAINAVLSEELGHHLDAKLNQTDTQGDEGQYFSGELLGTAITNNLKASLREVNDPGAIVVDGKTMEVELAESAPNKALFGNSLYYRLSLNNEDWYSSSAKARSLGGYLISIDNQAEQDFISNKVGIYFSHVMTGLSDLNVDGTYIKPDGSGLTYSNFLPGYPYPFGVDQPTAYALVITRTYFNTWESTWSTGQWYSSEATEIYNTSTVDTRSGEVSLGVYAEIPLSLSITRQGVAKEGAGVFTTSINLTAGTQTTGNLAEGAQVWWKISGITREDLASGSLTGSGTITNGKLDIQHALVIDADTGEQFSISVFCDAGMTQQIGSTNTVAVQETSPVIRGNSLYKSVDGTTWTAAEANSAAIGGHLVTINSAAEDTFVWDRYKVQRPSNDGNYWGYWIGLNRALGSSHLSWDSWSWVSGEEKTYQNPNFIPGITGEPNGGSSDLYTHIWGATPQNTVSKPYWNDTTNAGNPGTSSFAYVGVAEIPLDLSITRTGSIKEGAGVFTTSINLSAGTQTSGNLAEGATVYWKIDGITADDLASGALTGSGVINNGKLDVQNSLRIDSDANEQLSVSVFSDELMTQQIGATSSLAIQENNQLTLSWLSYSGQPTDEWSGGIATFSNGDVATAFSVSKSDGSSSVIVQRLSTNGVIVWSLDIGADYAPSSGSVLVGTDDTVYVTGGTKKGASGESGLNDSDIFAAAISPSGQKLWYKNYGIGIHEIGSTAVLDANGNILLEGRVSEVNDAYSFIKDVPNFYGEEFSGGWRGFQLRINPTVGSVSKAYTTGSGNSGGGPIAIDRSRNVSFVAGYTFGAVNGVNTVGNGDPNGANTYLIARNETTGAILWTRMENWMRSNVVAQESENAVYFVDKGNLEKVNVSTGQTIWSKALTNTNYVLSPITGGGVLLSESESNGTLTIRRFDSSGTESGSQVVSHTGNLYPRSFIEQGDGIIRISGVTSGAITVPTGMIVTNQKQTGNDSFVLQVNSSFSSADDVPSITLTVTPVSAVEDSTTNLIYTFTRTGPTANALTVNYSIGGTADSSDYTGATPGTAKTITFAAGSSTATLTIDPTADTTIEADETVALTLATGTGYTIGTASAVVGTISNDEPQVNRLSLDFATKKSFSDAGIDIRASFSNGSETATWIGGAQTARLSSIQLQQFNSGLTPPLTFSDKYKLLSEGETFAVRNLDGKIWGVTIVNSQSIVHGGTTNGVIVDYRLLYSGNSNSTPTGSPTLLGSPKPGSTLSVDTVFIQDSDNSNISTPRFSYGWEVSSDNASTWSQLTSTDATDNNNSYTLTAAENGKRIRSVVSYKDSAGNNETLYSGPSVWILDTSEVKKNRLAFDFDLQTSFADFGLDIRASFSGGSEVQTWIGGAETALLTTDQLAQPSNGSQSLSFSSSYKLLSEGETFAVRNQDGKTWAVTIVDSRSRTHGGSIDGAVVEYWLLYSGRTNSSPTGSPSITGTLKAGSTLSLDASAIKDVDNFSGYAPSYNYGWEVSSDNGATWTKLTSSDASDNNSSYTLATAEVGKRVRGVVSYLDGYGTNESVVSTATLVVSSNNQAPSNLALSSSAVNENIAAGSAIATLSTTDPDATDTFSYALVSGTGSTDNAAFSIAGNQLKINTSPDFESKSSYSIRIRSTDAGGLFFEKVVALNVSNVNETPTDLTLSAGSFNENIAPGSTIATLGTTDPDSADTFSYALVSGTGSTDNAAFSIAGNQLKINTSPDFESKSSYSIRIRSTDAGGLFFEKFVALNVNDLPEQATPPQGSTNTPSTTGNNSPATSVSNGSGTTIINNTTINNITNNINSNNTTTNNINNSISITGSFNGNTSAQALAGSLKLEDPATKTALPINGDSAIKTLAQLTASKPLSDAAKQLLDRYIIKDPSSSSSRKASADDAGFIDFTLKTGSLKSLTAEIALASEVKATAYVKVNPNTGEAYDFTFDPVTGLGAELLDTNKNGLVDSLRIHLQDGAKGDVDGLINGEIRDPGVLADAPRQSVYRFFKASKGVHLYTSSEAERANVNANPGWGYKDEGVAYEALVTQGTALRRFFNAKASYHFMTTNEEEAKNINAHPEWGFKDEGTSFSVSTVPQFGMSTPVNRFYRVLDGVGQHFYTASADEANNILANPQWGYKSEGVGWYV